MYENTYMLVGGESVNVKQQAGITKIVFVWNFIQGA
jgi:hypothetical protein